MERVHYAADVAVRKRSPEDHELVDQRRLPAMANDEFLHIDRGDGCTQASGLPPAAVERHLELRSLPVHHEQMPAAVSPFRPQTIVEHDVKAFGPRKVLRKEEQLSLLNDDSVSLLTPRSS